MLIAACPSPTSVERIPRAEEKREEQMIESPEQPHASGEPAIEHAAEIYEDMAPEEREVLLEELAKIEAEEIRKEARQTASMPSPKTKKKSKRSSRSKSDLVGTFSKKAEAKKDIDKVIEDLDKVIENLEPVMQQQQISPVDLSEKKH